MKKADRIKELLHQYTYEHYVYPGKIFRMMKDDGVTSVATLYKIYNGDKEYVSEATELSIVKWITLHQDDVYMVHHSKLEKKLDYINKKLGITPAEISRRLGYSRQNAYEHLYRAKSLDGMMTIEAYNTFNDLITKILIEKGLEMPDA